MKLTLHTLTPLWTGGIKGETDRLHETGIMGSLRWWYEVIVRGLGGTACDPSTHVCNFDDEKYKKAKRQGKSEQEALSTAGLCHVCQVFGATGWRRRFRIELVDTNLTRDPLKGQIKANRTYKDAKGKQRTPSWYLKGSGVVGDLTVRLIPTASGFDLGIVIGLIQLIATWGALGASAHVGFGVVKPYTPESMQPFLDNCKKLTGKQTYLSLPSVRNLFLARIQVATNQVQETLNLLYDLRRCFASNRGLRHFVMGTVRGQRLASKLKVSRPYDQDGKKVIRVWGWIPEDINFGTSKDDVLKTLHYHMQTHYTLEVWREFNSGVDSSGTVRDSTGTVYTDAYKFLCSLL